ncbi:MAG: PilW family protein [Immundisolibacter sp.]
MNSPGNARGFSLVELMVSMVVALLVMAAALRVFVGMNESFRLEDALSRLQENARYGFEALALDARQAGFTGCITTVNNLLDPSGANYDPALYDVNRPLTGFEFTGTDSGDTYTVTTLDPSGVSRAGWSDDTGTQLPAMLQDAVLPGTDVLFVKQASQRLEVTAQGNTPATAATVNLTGASGIDQDTIVLISDCAGADLFQNRAADNAATLSRGAGGDPGNLNPGGNDFSHAYGPGAEIYVLSATVYYVGMGVNGNPGLFRRRFLEGGTGSTQELIEGVENMQILYGEDTDADRVADVYVAADAVGDWARVVSVKVGLLMRTPQDARIDPDTATYAILGTTVDPPDQRRVRRVVSWTLALRNRVL